MVAEFPSNFLIRFERISQKKLLKYGFLSEHEVTVLNKQRQEQEQTFIGQSCTDDITHIDSIKQEILSDPSVLE